MRTNLIMHFHCAECGSVLNLRYDGDDAPKLETYGTQSGHDAEPTGAAVRYVSPVLVEPCRHCIEKHTGPAKRLAEAISALTTA